MNLVPVGDGKYVPERNITTVHNLGFETVKLKYIDPTYKSGDTVTKTMIEKEENQNTYNYWYERLSENDSFQTKEFDRGLKKDNE